MENNDKRIAEWLLTENNLSRISKTNFEVAVIPVGAVEAHNLHLPEGLDILHTTHIANESCKAAWQKCKSVICLPTIPFGVDCNQISFPIAIHISQNTLDAYIKEIILSLLHHKIRKIVIINGHGGNDFIPLIRQLQTEIDVHLFLCDWWKVGSDMYFDIFENKDDHAGEMETSVAMALHPELVEQKVAKDGSARNFRFEALKKGWVRTSRDFAKLNDHCAAGDPSKASVEKGKKYSTLVIERITSFITELAQTPIDDNFPLTNQ